MWPVFVLYYKVIARVPSFYIVLVCEFVYYMLSINSFIASIPSFVTDDTG